MYGIKESLIIIALSLVIVLPIRIFVAQPFVVSGDSMDSTFQNGNYLIVDEISYRFEPEKRGDVVVLKLRQKLWLWKIKTWTKRFFI